MAFEDVAPVGVVRPWQTRGEQLRQVLALDTGQVCQLCAARVAVGEYDGTWRCDAHRRQQLLVGDGDREVVVALTTKAIRARPIAFLSTQSGDLVPAATIPRAGNPAREVCPRTRLP